MAIFGKSPFTHIAWVVYLCMLLMSGCGKGSALVDAIHSPLYESIPHKSTIEATGEHYAGIKQIILHITKGTATDCTENKLPPSIIPCRQDAVTFTKTCSYTGSPTYATCSHIEDYGSQALISYYAEMVPSSGSILKSTEITYSAGYPQQTTGYKKYTAPDIRAVWWHRTVPPQSQIDFAFLPNKDYKGIYGDFTDDLDAIIPETFFNDQDSYARMFYLFRHEFNLWATPFGADLDAPSWFDGVTGSIDAVMDGSLILHNKNNFRDWGLISLGGYGTTSSTAISGGGYQSARTLIHESGHFLFGQGDEYCCDGGYFNSGSCKNVFDTESDCKTYVKALGFNPSKCVQLGSTSAWHLNHPGEIMGSTGAFFHDQVDWYECSRRCVYNLLWNCSMGKCY